MTAPFGDRLAAKVAETGSALCVGIDPRGPFPESVMRGLSDSRSGHARAVERYCQGLIEAAAPYCCAIKPQVALFELYGGYGLTALDAVCATAREHGLLIIADAKRGDIASTATAYAEAWIGIRPGESAPPAEIDALSRRLCARVNEKQRVLLTGAVVQGRFVIRMCILSFRTHADRIAMAIEDVAASLAELGLAG